MKEFTLQSGLYRFAQQLQRMEAGDAEEVRFRMQKLEAFEELKRQGVAVRHAPAILGVPLSTLYRWRQRLQQHGPQGVKNRSRRPKRVRRPFRHQKVVRWIQDMRAQHPAWGKRKIAEMYHREGGTLSESTIGRIIQEEVKAGRIFPAPRHVRRRRKSHPRPHAKRGWGGLPKICGKVVQIDHMTVKIGSRKFKQFTAVDVGSRFLVGQLYRSASARNAADFLDQVLRKMPMCIDQIQVDGGSEFKKEFEQQCAERKLPLIVLPPYSPQMNSRVEYVHGTCRNEFYACEPISPHLDQARKQFSQWQDVYNSVRPHQALDMNTPIEYIEQQS